MPTFNYRGLMVPVFTPFNNDRNRSLNLSKVPEYAEFLSSKNIKGILVNGTTGEGPSLTTIERKQVAEAWLAAVGKTKQHLMVQVGGTNLTEVRELAAHAEKIGVDSLLCLPDLYFKPTSAEDLIDYLQLVGLSAPNTPLLYYHIPSFSKVEINMGEFLESIGDKVPTFAGIKFTSNNLEEGYRAIKSNNSFAVFLGNDTLVAAACAIGMDSFTLTSLNFIPEPAISILEYGKGKKDLNSAKLDQELIIKVVEEVTRYGNWVNTMKIAMSLTTNLFMGPPRAPLKLLPREDVEAMAAGLSGFGLKTNQTALMQLY
ncbi:hypothetical protein QAD02_005162 [Eretmocerus hayati]|uniref:Uncharacterized protein n=1 Tax=Eretmocerus hayati TaxID=131215 RepID=A0ACC2NRL1_9HYME|nr:hypothetical protein QAD02_005162 [Eretmocerus hayati]